MRKWLMNTNDFYVYSTPFLETAVSQVSGWLDRGSRTCAMGQAPLPACSNIVPPLTVRGRQQQYRLYNRRQALSARGGWSRQVVLPGTGRLSFVSCVFNGSHERFHLNSVSNWVYFALCSRSYPSANPDMFSVSFSTSEHQSFRCFSF
jgi:hypothetical protein